MQHLKLGILLLCVTMVLSQLPYLFEDYLLWYHCTIINPTTPKTHRRASVIALCPPSSHFSLTGIIYYFLAAQLESTFSATDEELLKKSVLRGKA